MILKLHHNCPKCGSITVVRKRPVIESAVVSGITLSGQILTENPKYKVGNNVPAVYYCEECAYCYASGDQAFLTYMKTHQTKFSFDCMSALKECVELKQITDAQAQSLFTSYFHGERTMEEIQLLIRGMFAAAGKTVL